MITIFLNAFFSKLIQTVIRVHYCSNQKEINTQQLKLLDNFRKWKEQQLKAENTTRESFKTYQKHIEEMLEDKKKLIDNFHDLYKDYSLLQNELDRFKMSSLRYEHNSKLICITTNKFINIFFFLM